jgi:hypothetical protein
MQTVSIEMLNDEALLQRSAHDSKNRWLRRKLRGRSTTGGFFFRKRNVAPPQTTTASSNRKQNFALFLGTHVAGLVSVECAPNLPNVLIVSDMTVEHNQVWEPIHAQALLEAAFQYASEQQMTLSPVNLNAQGKSVIQNTLAELEQKYSQHAVSVRN